MAWIDLDKGEMFVYEWQKGMLGSFENELAELICMADTYSQDKLAKGYPEEVHAIKKYQTESGWYETLTRKVEQ